MSVRPSVGPSVRRSVRRSVRNLFFRRAETKTANDLFRVYELVDNIEALTGANEGMDGWFTVPGGGQGRKNHRDLTGDRFQATVSLFTHE